MDKKKVIIITITLAVVGLFAYLIFFSGKPKEDDASLPSFSATESSRKHKREKQTDQQNAQSANGVITQADFEQSSSPDAQPQSFQNQQRPAQQGYFNITPILSSSQLNRPQSRTSSQLSTTFTQSDFKPATPSGVGSGGGSSSSGGAGFSSSSPRMEPCIAALQPILAEQSKDVSAITSALLNVAGFSMLPVATQNTHIQSVVTQSKGTTAEPYCKFLIQSTNPQSINIAGLYNDCQSVVHNFYNTKTSGTSEYDAVSAFEALGILNGATTSTQKKTVLQKYLGAEYDTVITAMKGLNANNIEMQKRIICAKISSGVVNEINGSSPYLSCVTSINSAKKSNISDVATAIPVYSRLIGGDQILVAKGYKEFLAGTKTAEELCTFIIKNTTISTKEADVLSSMVLNSSDGMYQACDAIVSAIKATYNDYLVNSNIDEIAQITRAVDPYEFLIPQNTIGHAVQRYVTNKISNATFRALSVQNQTMIGSRLYATYYSLSSFTNPAIDGVYSELFPQLCKCSHIDFDDMAWKKAVVSYMLSKRSGTTPLSVDSVAKEATIASSEFRKTCTNDITTQFKKSTITLETATPKAMAAIIQSISPEYKALTQIESIVTPLSCYADKCMTGICPQSCLYAVESVCDRLTEAYLTTVPQKTDTSTIFNCPQTAQGKVLDSNVCYALTDAQRAGITQSFYVAIQNFKTDAEEVRKEIIKELWRIHTKKQKETNTSVASSQCLEQAGTKWVEKLQE